MARRVKSMHDIASPSNFKVPTEEPNSAWTDSYRYKIYLVIIELLI